MADIITKACWEGNDVMTLSSTFGIGCLVTFDTTGMWVKGGGKKVKDSLKNSIVKSCSISIIKNVQFNSLLLQSKETSLKKMARSVSGSWHA